VSEAPLASSPLSVLTLRTVRRYIRRSHAVMMTAFFAIVYALGSMVLGSMLILTHLTPPYYAEVVWSGGAPSWNYPGLLIVQPWGVATLPFFPTISMVVVSVGVGIGMSVAVLLAVALVRERRASAGRPAAVGSVAGLTPAMIALVTLGACCSTTAAATAGVGLVGQVTGTSTGDLLLNNWFLGVFQVAVVWIALVAQEMILRVYGGLFGTSNRSGFPTVTSADPRSTYRSVLASALLRFALLVGGITWSLAVLADWTLVAPAGASATQWFSWIVEHQLVALVAIAAALFPSAVRRGFSRTVSWSTGTVVRIALAVGGATLLIGVPPPFSSEGAGGLGNQIVSVLGGSAAFGASVPPVGLGAGLLFSWILQFGLLGVFALALAIAPRWTMGPLLRSAHAAAPDAISEFWGPLARVGPIPTGNAGDAHVPATAPNPGRSES
jgi:hypothetical protein